MPEQEQPLVPLWAEAKARKQIDVVREAARTLEEAERLRAAQSVATMKERDLEAEQLRLEELLHDGELTVDGFRRLREIDFYLEAMHDRRHRRPAFEEWTQEQYTDD